MDFGKWRFLLGVLVVGVLTPVACTQLDTLEVYGNAADPPGSSFTSGSPTEYTITAGGSDFWGNPDTGAFLHQAGSLVSGDFTAIVRSVSFGGPDPLAPEWGRSGPMARANAAAADSANVMTVQKSGGGTGMVFQGRPSAGAGTDRNGLNGDFPDSGGASAVNGVPIWMALSRMGDVFLGTWAPDNAGVPGAWSDAAVRVVTPDLSGDLSVGLAHQSHSVPRTNSVNFDNWSVGPLDATLPGLPPADPFLGVGPGPVDNGFGVRFVYYDALGDINNVGQAINILKAGTGTIVDGTFETSNTADNGPGGSAGGGYTLSAPKDRYLGAPDGDNNDVAWIYNGILDIPADGMYTFGIDGDDGQRMKIEGADFTKQAGGGSVIPVDGARDAFEFYGNTGDAFTTASTFLSAGQHRIEYIGYERGGGAFGEAFSAVGEIKPGDNVQWLAINSPVNADEFIYTQVAQLTSDARVINGASIGDIAAADAILRTRASIDAAKADWANSPKGVTDTLVIPEGDMPNGGGDDYTTGVFGEFAVLDTDGAPGEIITFGLRSDDGSQLRIFGQDFTGVNDFSGDTNATLVDVDGDMALTAEYPTGDTNAFAVITLAEGTYAFEALQYEGGGGSNLDVYAVAGDWLSTGFPKVMPLTTSSLDPYIIPGNVALNLVPEPSSLALAFFGLLGLLGLRRRR